MRRHFGHAAQPFALLLLLSGAAAAQSTVRPPGAAPSLPPALRASVDRLADSARTAGVPTDPLYLKAAEGMLKGADEARVVEVVRRLLGELTESRRVLGPTATAAELVAGANVLHAHVDPQMLQRVRDLQPASHASGSLVMPLVVLADLVSRRVSADVAVTSVGALVERGAPDRELARLRSSVERDIASGQTPDLAVRARTDGVLTELGVPARPVLPKGPQIP